MTERLVTGAQVVTTRTVVSRSYDSYLQSLRLSLELPPIVPVHTWDGCLYDVEDTITP